MQPMLAFDAQYERIPRKSSLVLIRACERTTGAVAASECCWVENTDTKSMPKAIIAMPAAIERRPRRVWSALTTTGCPSSMALVQSMNTRFTEEGRGEWTQLLR